MIYYLTIHWKSDKWIRIQHKMLRKFTGSDYKTFGFLNGVDTKYYDLFDQVRTDEDDPTHADKLDILARIVLEDSKSESDLMIFIDGDAFPIGPVYPRISGYLKTYALAAVQRLENDGEQHAHPSFCATTVGFWRRYHPTWQPGRTWFDTFGDAMTDVGGNLFGVLEDNNIVWKPLHRSNTKNLHPLLFGIYDDLVYHHGTGFRAGSVVRSDYTKHVAPIRRLDGRLLLRFVPRRYHMDIRKSILHPQGRMWRKLAKQTHTLGSKVYAQIVNDVEQFISTLR